MRANLKRNFLNIFLVALIFWLILVGLIYSFPPEGMVVWVIFFLLLFGASFFTFALIFKSSRRGLLSSIWVVAFMGFRAYGVGSWFNQLLFTLFLVTLEIYWTKYK
jgi:hypothetical protein